MSNEMQEDIRKNFVLLSKVAKERKYAQEYLGLLARRGDLGSIRIGKRWYTTLEWFAEFEKDAQRKKAEMKTPQVESEPAKTKTVEKINIEKVFSEPRVMEFVPRDLPDKIEIKQKIGMGRESIQKEKQGITAEPGGKAGWENFYTRKETEPIKSNSSKVEIKKAKIVPVMPEAKQSFRTGMKYETVDPIRKNFYNYSQTIRAENNSPSRIWYAMDISSGVNFRKINRDKKLASPIAPEKKLIEAKNILREEKEQSRVQEKKEEFQILNVARGISPSFLPKEKARMAFLPKFAFAGSLVLLFFLLIQIGYSHKKEISSLARLDSHFDLAEWAARQAGFGSGVVAGAEDSKVDLAFVKNQSIDYLGNQGSEVKENISLARVLVRAALERSNEQGSTNNDQ